MRIRFSRLIFNNFPREPFTRICASDFHSGTRLEPPLSFGSTCIPVTKHAKQFGIPDSMGLCSLCHVQRREGLPKGGTPDAVQRPSLSLPEEFAAEFSEGVPATRANSLFQDEYVGFWKIFQRIGKKIWGGEMGRMWTSMD